MRATLALNGSNFLLTLKGANPTEWSNTLKQSVGKLIDFDRFVRLAIKGLTIYTS